MYIINLILSKSVPKTPREMWTGRFATSPDMGVSKTYVERKVEPLAEIEPVLS